MSVPDAGVLGRTRGRVAGARRLVILTGAGVSAESGVPTFRGAGGLWRNYRAEDLATPGAFARDPGLVWEWYAWRMSVIAPLSPNAAHRAIAALDVRKGEFLLVTQNVDGLHSRAGSTAMVELHGNIWRTLCLSCSRRDMTHSPPRVVPPSCPACGGMLRPDVVWFGEAIPPGALNRSLEAVRSCDVFIAAGTSAQVQPAASFGPMAAAAGAYVIEVNTEETALTAAAHETHIGKAGDILPRILPAGSGTGSA